MIDRYLLIRSLQRHFSIASGCLVHLYILSYSHLLTHRTVGVVVGSRRVTDVYINADGEGLILYILVVLDKCLIVLLYYI